MVWFNHLEGIELQVSYHTFRFVLLLLSAASLLRADADLHGLVSTQSVENNTTQHFVTHFAKIDELHDL